LVKFLILQKKKLRFCLINGNQMKKKSTFGSSSGMVSIPGYGSCRIEKYSRRWLMISSRLALSIKCKERQRKVSRWPLKL
jgi:hypothetical protein